MKLRKFLKFLFGLLIIFAVTLGLISINHPIILKWVTGSARHFGKPTEATVYINGQINDNIKVYYSDEPNQYLLSFTGFDSSGMQKYFNIDLHEKWIGSSLGTTKKDYDLIAGHLFLSKAGQIFSPIQDETKGFNFDPRFSFTDRQIKFTMPPNDFKIDSVRIKLL